ncbi:hypothetical protein ACU8V3_02440 [Cobetia marina]
MRVLLVEDDPLLGEGIGHALSREGMSSEWLRVGAMSWPLSSIPS